jgi:hypothetical protein
MEGRYGILQRPWLDFRDFNRRSFRAEVLVATVFDTIITQGVRSGQIPARTQQSRDWFRETAGKMRNINERSLMRGDQARLTSTPIPGSMYMFNYDPKWKDELPYYDRFPLVFPFRKVPGGFYGLNLHYLPPPLRARLMDALYDYANNTRYDESTKIKLNYQLLTSIAKLRFFSPCVKHYLNEHVRSRFMYVYPSEWDIALFLPTERFTKQSKTQVWNDSKRMLGVRK